MDYLVKNEKRNRYIRNLVSSLQGNTLVLFQYVEKHGTELKKLIEEKESKEKYSLYMVVWRRKKEKR